MIPVYLYITTSFLVTFFFTPFLRFIAHQWNILDVPDGKIKTHSKPIPYLGGLALFLGFSTSLLFSLGSLSFTFSVYMCGLILLLLIGLVDDLYPLGAGAKFCLEIGVTLLFIQAGLVAQFSVLPTVLNYGISIGWMLTLINAFNLIDIMDGLAGTVGGVIIINFLVIAYCIGSSSLTLLLLSFLGALIGFLFYNFPPATIYLGDAGALLFGGFVATLPFMVPWKLFGNFGFLIPVMLCIIPLLEVATLVMIRTYKGIPFWHASPDHFAQALRAKGWPKKNILYGILSVGVLQAVISLSALARLLPASFFYVLFLFLVASWYGALFYRKDRSYNT